MENPTITVTQDDIARLAASFNTFGLRLLAQVATAAPAPGSVALAPFAVANELTALLKGAGGATATQLAQVLHLDGVHGHHASAIAQALRHDLQGAALGDELLVANSLWLDERYDVAPEFVQMTEMFFGAHVGAIASREPEHASALINAWIDASTGGKFGPLTTPAEINGAALLLVSAVYFKGAWATPFSQAATAPAAFTRSDGKVQQTPFMHLHTRLTHRTVDGVQLVYLPFGGERLGMVLALPPASQPLREFQRALDAVTWSEWLQDFSSDEGALTLPRFRLRTDLHLEQALRAMGLDVPFTPAADFHKIGPGPLTLAAVLHNTQLAVNEEGAVAATGMAPMTRNLVHHRLDIVFDRPFLAAVVDVETEAILFAGYICAPTE